MVIYFFIKFNFFFKFEFGYLCSDFFLFTEVREWVEVEGQVIDRQVIFFGVVLQRVSQEIYIERCNNKNILKYNI